MTTKKHDFIELKFTGYHDEKVFDSNIEEDLKELNPDSNAEKTIIAIGEEMVVPALDKALEGKEIGKEYKVHVPYKEGFGERKRELVKTIPLSAFRGHKIDPKPGMSFLMDNMLVRVITVSGARVITDFNNPLAGKDIDYKFTIARILSDSESEEKEKCEAFFKHFFRFVPEFKIEKDEVIVLGEKPIEEIVKIHKDKFKNLLKKDLAFKEKEPEKTTEEKVKASGKVKSR